MLGKRPDNLATGFQKSVEQVCQHEKNNTRRMTNTQYFVPQKHDSGFLPCNHIFST